MKKQLRPTFGRARRRPSDRLYGRVQDRSQDCALLCQRSEKGRRFRAGKGRQRAKSRLWS